MSDDHHKELRAFFKKLLRTDSPRAPAKKLSTPTDGTRRWGGLLKPKTRAQVYKA